MSAAEDENVPSTEEETPSTARDVALRRVEQAEWSVWDARRRMRDVPNDQLLGAAMLVVNACVEYMAIRRLADELEALS